MAIASLVLGILAILGCSIPIFGFLFAIISLIIAIIAKVGKKAKGEQEGLKIAGLILSIVAFVISLLVAARPILLTISIINTGDDIINEATNNLNQISDMLKSQIIASYDGKIKTGSEILATIRQYEKSNSIAIIITAKELTYNVGAGVITLPRGTTADDYAVGGIIGGMTTEGTTKSYFEMAREIQPYKSYKTAVVYDINNNLIGIAIVEY